MSFRFDVDGARAPCELDPRRALEVATDEGEAGQRSDELRVSRQELERLLPWILAREELIDREADLSLQRGHDLEVADEEPSALDLEQRVPHDVARVRIDREVARGPARVDEPLVPHRQLARFVHGDVVELDRPLLFRRMRRCRALLDHGLRFVVERRGGRVHVPRLEHLVREPARIDLGRHPIGVDPPVIVVAPRLHVQLIDDQVPGEIEPRRAHPDHRARTTGQHGNADAQEEREQAPQEDWQRRDDGEGENDATHLRSVGRFPAGFQESSSPCWNRPFVAYSDGMAQAVRRDAPGEPPDLRTIAKVTAVIVAVVAFAALLATLLVLGAQIILVGFLGILCALVFVTISTPVARRLHMKRKHAFVMVVTLTFLGLGALVFFTGDQLVSQFDELLAKSSETFTVLQDKAKSLPAPIGGRNGAASGNATPPDAPQVVAGAVKVASTVTGIASACFLVALMSFFCGYAPEEYIDAGIELLPESWRERAQALSDATYADLKQWLFAQLFTMAFDAVFVFVGLTIAGVKLAPVLAIVTGVCGFVPYLGAFVAPIPGILVVMGEDPSKLPFVIGVYFAVQMIEGWIVTPLVQKKRNNIPPALLLFFQALIGLVAGPLGVVVSTPLLVVIMTWVRVLVIEPRGD